MEALSNDHFVWSTVLMTCFCRFVAAVAAAQAIHLANQSSQQQMYSALAPTPPSMTPGPNPQSPQASFPSAQQTVYIHPQQVQHGYNPNHMAHVQQVGHNLLFACWTSATAAPAK